MKALQLTQWKHAPELRDVPEPEPGPGELVVRVGAAGACGSDLHLIDEWDSSTLNNVKPPFTIGHENAGWIDSLGVGVKGFEVGQPVAVYGPWGCGTCKNCRLSMENYCLRLAELDAWGGGLGFDGGMATKMLVPSSRLVVPLGDLEPIKAAPLSDAGLTPYHAIKRSLHLLGAGSSVVVIGAGGGLGHMAIQILRAMTPANVIAVDTRESGLQLAKDNGAHHGVLSGEHAAAEILDLTGGNGAEVVLDLVGANPTLKLAAECAGLGGHLTIVGIAGGTLPVSYFSQKFEVSIATTYWGSVLELMEVLALAERGLIAAHITKFSLDEAPAMYDKLRAGEVVGRAVVVPE
jgi:propanol-preferring alcohol dehydrogenase